MSDYLSRAVERETSTGLAVRPALPSLFEPAPPAAIATAPEAESPIEGDPSRNTPDNIEPKISPLHERLTAVDALWPDPVIGAAEQPRQSEEAAEKSFADLAAPAIGRPSATTVFSTGSSPAKEQQLPVATATEPAGRPTAETPPIPHLPATQGIVRPTAGAPPKSLHTATEEIVGSTVVPQPRPPVHRAAAQEVVRPVPASPSAEVGAVPTTGERAATSPTAPPARSAPASSEPESAMPPAPAPLTKVLAPAHATIPRISPAPSSPERAGSANSVPSPRPVHITIGRIEVRAVHPPPEPVPHRPAPAAPRISLEEYLKQRNGGRR
jgi:hypothetical protein